MSVENVADVPDLGRPDVARAAADDSQLVQIKASNAEIMRRISALIEQKQREVDINNCQEFCGIHPALEAMEDSCSRTTAVFVPRAGGKSHIKVSRVVNMYGPQTRNLGQTLGSQENNSGKQTTNSAIDGLEERLSNMEDHLRISGSTTTDVFSRLKSLEERILFLETLSPEYFTSGPPPAKKQKKEEKGSVQTGLKEEMSIGEIDARIQELRESLCRKIDT
ncbi:MAP3K12-binding inhibitory protein 1-like [Mya arenaria]|uniref:MAP3K12-binding inhibitory protein 1-like n=1 Tax=Mya arenaria TaxID=6604 RepID=UPI0022E19787|nr:MAP3K12-binding inhibitory protein 1-like [Mya arenaria]XP_052767903.1 MAP3K12-binding inhibitory protein 1-like [Mya arenaria]